jgi:hypothetical protein
LLPVSGVHFGRPPATGSYPINSAVNRLIDGFDGERLPAINGGTLIWLQVSNS